MNQANFWERIRPWLKPGLTILLGLILIFRPDSVTSLIGTVIGFAVALVGCGLLVSFFLNKARDGLRLAAAIILMVLGFSVIRYPLSLATQLGRFIGIFLVLQSVGGILGAIAPIGKALAAVTGVIGLVLMLIPITASRLAATVCGIVVLVVGIGMLLESLNDGPKEPGDENIVDAR